MKRLYIFICSSFLLLSTIYGQEKDSIVIEVPPPLIRPAIYIDYGKIATKLIGWEDKLEGAASLLVLDHYELVGEVGRSVLAPEESYVNGNYSAEGFYYRVGLNFSNSFKNEYRIAFGARYAASNFSDQGVIEIESNTIENAYNREFGDADLEARWWELVLTSDKKIFFNKEMPEKWFNNIFTIGFNLRLRFLVTYDKRTPIDVYSIPGYGKSIDNVTPVVNLFLKAFLF